MFIIATVRTVISSIFTNSIHRATASSGASAVVVVINVQITKSSSSIEIGVAGNIFFSGPMAKAIIVTTAAISAN